VAAENKRITSNLLFDTSDNLHEPQDGVEEIATSKDNAKCVKNFG
jgi:hypothetical protein